MFVALLIFSGAVSAARKEPHAGEYKTISLNDETGGVLLWPLPLSPPPGLVLASNGTLIFTGGPGGNSSATRYINRELSWLAFCERVLAEALSPRHPLLERLRFLSISYNNLDEFYMVRIAGLAQLAKENTMNAPVVAMQQHDNLSPAAQLAQVIAASRTLLNDQQRVWRMLKRELHESGVASVVPVSELGPEDRAYLHETFLTELWPQLTPQSIDSAHPFPFISNREMGLLLTLVRRNGPGDEGAGGDGDGEAPGRVGGGGGGSGAPPKRSKRKGEGNTGSSLSPAAPLNAPPAQDKLSHAAIPDEMRAILLLPRKVQRFIKLPDRTACRVYEVSNSSNTAGVAAGRLASGSGGGSGGTGGGAAAAASAAVSAKDAAEEGACSGGAGARFVLVEDMLSNIELASFFPERTVKEKGLFRVLRDSEVEVDEEAVDLVRMFETALKRRRKGAAIRLDVDASMPEEMRKWLAAKMDVQRNNVYLVESLVGLVDVQQMIGPSAAAYAHRGSGGAPVVFPKYTERTPARIAESGGDIFAAIARKDIIVHHPFESFNTVLQFLQQAARDPNVLAIKQTLYRTSHDSPIVQSLVEAAESGKTVTALIELKARFDEEANIRWAKDLERAGVHVVFGFRELKTHAKLSVVVRREQNSIVRTYVHLGTGNYHPDTAKVYTDLSLFTADPAMGRDATRLFNFCSGYSIAALKEMEHLAVAPATLRSTLERLIRAEMDNAKAGLPASIVAKVNALVDTALIDSLYAASEAGVNITLVVRGMCSLRPGIPGLSSRIYVKSVVGRFLEHSRIVAFGNGYPMPSARNLLFISSADWMTRNLDWRVEALVPILNPTVHRQVLHEVLVQTVLDEANSWALSADGFYERVLDPTAPRAREPHNAHAYFLTHESLSGRGEGDSGQHAAPTRRRRQQDADI